MPDPVKKEVHQKTYEELLKDLESNEENSQILEFVEETEETDDLVQTTTA